MAEDKANAEKNDQKKEAKKPTPHEPKADHKSKWSLAKAHKIAKRYANPVGWEKGHPSSFKAATHWGWLEECCAHMSTKPASVHRIDKPKKTATKKKATKTAAKRKKSA